MIRDRLRTRAATWLRASVPVVCVSVLLVLAVVHVRTTVVSAARTVGATFEVSQDGMRVVELAPDGPAAEAGFEVGDLLQSLQGRQVGNAYDYDRAAGQVRQGEAMVFTVLRDGRVREIRVEPGVDVRWTPLLISTFSALAITLVGLLALFRSSGYINGRLLFAFSVLAAAEFVLPTQAIGEVVVMHFVAVFFVFLTGAQMAVELHLVTLVPQRPHWARGKVIAGYYAVGLGLSLAVVLAYVAEVTGNAWFWSLTDALFVQVDVGLPAWATAVAGLLAARAVTYPQKEGRVQAAIVLAGTMPWVIYVYSDAVAGLRGQELPEWVQEVVPLVMVTFAASILWVMFREARIRKRILVDLVDRMEESQDRSEIYAFIGQKLDLVFHPTSAHILGVDPEHGRQLILEHSSVGPLPAPPPELQGLRDLARQIRRPFDLNRTRLELLPESERRWLEEAGTLLVVPLVGPAVRTVGMVLMGQKKAEEAYSFYDKQLLKSLSSHVSVVLENLHLHDDVSRGRRAQREVVHRLLDEDVSVLEECPACHRCFDGGQGVCPHDGESLELTMPVERLVADRYRLERRIDRGGMGAIFEATDLRLDRKVAVKILLEFGQAEALRRFEREARICARLNHPNIVSVHDYGRLRGDGAYLVMELLEGRSLRTFLREQVDVRPEKMAEIFDQLFDALESAHRQKVIHRDLKPSNLFLADRGAGETTLKILDFGLAKARDAGIDDGLSFTSPGSFLGTLPYMAPEQIAGARVDARADLFAIGVIAFEVLAGRWPFEGETRSALVHAIAHQPPLFPEDWDEDSELRRILDRALAKMAAERHPTAGDLRRELVPAITAVDSLGLPVERRGRGERSKKVELPSRTERIDPASDSVEESSSFGAFGTVGSGGVSSDSPRRGSKDDGPDAREPDEDRYERAARRDES